MSESIDIILGGASNGHGGNSLISGLKLNGAIELGLKKVWRAPHTFTTKTISRTTIVVADTQR